MRLINADALKEEITQYFNDVMDIGEIKTINTVISIIDNAPTVEPETKVVANVSFNKEETEELVKLFFKAKADILPQVERPQGEWQLDDTEQFCYCSNCEDTYYPRPLDPSWHYCPHCGADMRGEKK